MLKICFDFDSDTVSGMRNVGYNNRTNTLSV